MIAVAELPEARESGDIETMTEQMEASDSGSENSGLLTTAAANETTYRSTLTKEERSTSKTECRTRCNRC